MLLFQSPGIQYFLLASQQLEYRFKVIVQRRLKLVAGTVWRIAEFQSGRMQAQLVNALQRIRDIAVAILWVADNEQPRTGRRTSGRAGSARQTKSIRGAGRLEDQVGVARETERISNLLR